MKQQNSKKQNSKIINTKNLIYTLIFFISIFASAITVSAFTYDYYFTDLYVSKDVGTAFGQNISVVALINSISNDPSITNVSVMFIQKDGTIHNTNVLTQNGVNGLATVKLYYSSVDTENLTVIIDPLNVYNDTNVGNNNQSISFTTISPYYNIHLGNVSETTYIGELVTTNITIINSGNVNTPVTFSYSSLQSGSNSISVDKISLNENSKTIDKNTTVNNYLYVNVPKNQTPGTYSGLIFLLEGSIYSNEPPICGENTLLSL